MQIEQRAIKHIQNIIENLQLNLSGLTILTEIGNNYYFYLPFIAALAGAKKVYAWTAKNKYFNCDKLVADAKSCTKQLGFNNVIEFTIDERPCAHVADAQIITNSGFVRPLDETLLQHAKKNTVITLMFEAWELRDTDIDINFCRKKGIRVGGTNENYPSIKVFESVGPLAIKLAMEAGMEVYQNNILIWSDDEFGKVTEAYFKKMNAANVVITTSKETALSFLSVADFIYFCSNHEKRTIISNIDNDAIFTIDEIKSKNQAITIVHLYGKFNLNELESNGLHIYPKQNGKAEYMSKTLTHIGMKPTLNLLTAGLKVGELLYKNEQSTLVQVI